MHSNDDITRSETDALSTPQIALANRLLPLAGNSSRRIVNKAVIVSRGPLRKMDHHLIRLFSILALAFLTPPALLAQSSATTSRSVAIHIGTGLSISAIRPLNFGNVISGAGPYSVALTDGNTGKAEVSGQWNKTVNVTLTPPAVLSDGNGHTISYTPLAAYNNTADAPATATSMPPAGITSFSLRADHVGGSATGDAYIYLYGSINVGNVAPGLYTGLYTISVSY